MVIKRFVDPFTGIVKFLKEDKAKKKKGVGKLTLGIKPGPGVLSPEVGKAMLARQAAEKPGDKDPKEQIDKVLHPDIASGKRTFIPRSETHPEEFVKVDDQMLTPQEAMLREQLIERITKEEEEEKEPEKPTTAGRIKEFHGLISGEKEELKKFGKGLAITAGVAAAILTVGKTLGLTRAALAPAIRTGGRAGGLGGGKATAVITREKYAHEYVKGRLLPRGTVQTQRAFVGKPAKTGVDKLFHAVKPVAARYASNTKSSVITKRWLTGLGLSIGAAGLFVTAVGTYPFAGFLKQEAVQQTGFGVYQAIKVGDIEGMEAATQRIREIVEAEDEIVDKIPYANVMKQVREYMKSTRVTLEIYERELAKLKGGI